jgi:hypothetical protein
LYANGEGVAKNIAQATTYFRRGCDEGDMAGCYDLGVLYTSGQGVAVDLARASTFFKRACDGGLVAGCDAVKQVVPSGR